MIMSKALVWATAIFFILYGGLFVIFPVELSVLVTDTAPGTPSALMDMRATYGGMSIAVGITLLLLASRPKLIGLALLVTGLVLLGMAVGRGLGMIIDGTPNAIMYVYLAAELFFGVLALMLRNREEET